MLLEIRNQSIHIFYDREDWTKNITVTIHDENTLGTEAFNSVVRVNNSLLKIDYCWFFTENCPVNENNLNGLIGRIYKLY
jgi:hypothetical protein